MYFVQYHTLKERLRERSLSDREALPYFLLFFAGLTVVHVVPTGEEFNEFDIVSGVLSVIFGIGGVLYAYEQNGRKKGFDLIQKFVVLGWVVSFRFLLVLLSVLIVWVVLGIEETTETRETDGFDVLFIALVQLIFYQRIGRHIRDTSNKKLEVSAQPPQLNSVC